jgi:hypothetical protein
MLKLSIQCTRFEVIIVVVHVGAAKIYVAAVEALTKRKHGSKQDETQFGTKSGAFLSLTPLPLKANVLFCRFF